MPLEQMLVSANKSYVVVKKNDSLENLKLTARCE